jgi:hypothetical protein
MAESGLASLLSSLIAFFEQHPHECYFVKFSSISPKDAYDRFHGLQYDSAESLDAETEFEIIKRDTGFLKVGVPLTQTAQATALHCLQILCHSNRYDSLTLVLLILLLITFYYTY